MWKLIDILFKICMYQAEKLKKYDETHPITTGFILDMIDEIYRLRESGER